jgi:hypothetical protein
MPRTPDTAQGSEEEEARKKRALLGAVTGFGLGTVFDIAQTEGDPLPAPHAPHHDPAGGGRFVASKLWSPLGSPRISFKSIA